ncbi:hypothetical protein BJX70DRAFT_382371 [Aspergillus crustosus]
MFARQFAFRALTQQYPRSTLSPGYCSSSTIWRYFSSSIARPKASRPEKKIPFQTPKPTLKPKANTPPEETLKFAGRRSLGFAKLERRVAKEGEILLFRAPSHSSYIFGAYGIAFFCFAYSIYNSNAVFRDPVIELPQWQKGLAGGICIVMSAMGTVFVAKTGRLIKTVKAVHSNGQAYIRFSVRNIIPFLKPRQFDVQPRQVAFMRRVVISPDTRPRQTETLTSSNKTSSIMKLPAKKISQLLYTLFRSIRQIFTQEDFILLEVEGQRGVFRMDSAGYISEDFLFAGVQR